LTPTAATPQRQKTTTRLCTTIRWLPSSGKEAPLSTFKGKVLLVVNLASQSIFKEQIPQLEELQKKYKDQGLVVVGVPCNDFGAQERREPMRKYRRGTPTSSLEFSRICQGVRSG